MTNVSPLCCINGEFVPQDSIKIGIQNRAFRYGDAVFETIRCFGNRPFLFDLHYERLINALETLEMDTLGFPVADVLEKKIERLVNKNRFFCSSRIRLSVFRNDGGLYTPADNTCSYLIEASPLEEPAYVLNNKGLVAGIYPHMQKQPSLISPFKTANSLLFVMAGNYKVANNFSEILIKNSHGLIVEALSSNIFWFQGEILCTPSVESGCVNGIMRQTILKVANLHGIQTKEVPGIDEISIKRVDELFVTNAIQGIQWVVGIDDVRFYNLKTRQLYQYFLQTIS
jgi:branched-subunit amino acid aminotransferase/4-amino-4-deoxychorismate lyase